MVGLIRKLFSGSTFSKPKSLSAIQQNKIEEEWQKIEELIRRGQPSQLKEAVIRADKLVDFALKHLVDGDSMGERLKNSRDLFSPKTYQELWEAHKARNALVHEEGYDPPYYVSHEGLEKFKKGLRELGVKIV